jgi:hypothetical protein
MRRERQQLNRLLTTDRKASKLRTTNGKGKLWVGGSHSFPFSSVVTPDDSFILHSSSYKTTSEEGEAMRATTTNHFAE